jgi:sarcosine oxidase delta subunit
MIDVRWRDVPTATMIYDRQPWKDYFRLLTKENGKVVLLGVWTHKHIAGGWFTLTLDADAVTN